MLYSLDLFKEYQISYSWDTIILGRYLNFLSLIDISTFSIEYLQNNSSIINPYIAELAMGAKETEIDNLLLLVYKSLNIEKIVPNSLRWNLERIKWRYCVLHYLLKAIKDKEKLFEEIDYIYYKFGFPKDMDDFIVYMPHEDKNEYNYDKHSAEENFQHLINKLKNFLMQQKENIDKSFINPDSLDRVYD